MPFSDAALKVALTFIQQAAQRPIGDAHKTAFAVARTQATLKIPSDEAKLLVEAGVQALIAPVIEPPPPVFTPPPPVEAPAQDEPPKRRKR